MFLVEADWPQPQAYTCDNLANRNSMRAPLATLNSYVLNSQPVLVNIPSGPHSVTFTFRTLDSLTAINEEYTVYMSMTIVPANSRQSPLN